MDDNNYLYENEEIRNNYQKLVEETLRRYHIWLENNDLKDNAYHWCFYTDEIFGKHENDNLKIDNHE